MNDTRPGVISTFYSYKGGTGRSMALANVAWILASCGCRVLVVDWDLEAPGLHRYFHPFLDDPEMRLNEGILELAESFVHLMSSKPADWPPSINDPLKLADPKRFALAANYTFPENGCLHVIGAGRQDEGYASKMRGLDWKAFYEKFSGNAFIEAFGEQARRQYDHVLIDSRTGIADTSGICTMQLPQQVVLCYTYNRQSIEGVASVAASIRKTRKEIRLFPLAMRVIDDIEGLDTARAFARKTIGPHIDFASDPEDAIDYWANAEIPHYPAYGFEERLASFVERPGHRNNLLADMEWLAGCIEGPARPTPRQPRIDKETRERILRRFKWDNKDVLLLEEALTKQPEKALEGLRRRITTGLRDELGQAYANGLSELKQKLAAEGKLEEALTASENAIYLRRAALKANPKISSGDIATELVSHATIQSSLGRRDEAIAAIQEAIAIRRTLAKKEPSRFLPDLAAALNNLCAHLMASARSELALASAQESTEIRRKLAQEKPATFLPDLANSLNSVGLCLVGLGRIDDARAAFHESIEIRKRLANERPLDAVPDLASSTLNVSKKLLEINLHDDALNFAKEANDIYQALARDRPHVFDFDLARSFATLARALAGAGRYNEAISAARDGMAIIRASTKHSDIAMSTLHRELVAIMDNAMQAGCRR